MIVLLGTYKTEKAIVCAWLDNKSKLDYDMLLGKPRTCVTLED